MNLRFALCLLVTASACTQVPELNERVSPRLKNADYPALVPLEPTLGPPVAPEEEAEKVTEQLAARRDNLQRRAQLLQKPVVTENDRDRLDESIPRPASD